MVCDVFKMNLMKNDFCCCCYCTFWRHFTFNGPINTFQLAVGLVSIITQLSYNRKWKTLFYNLSYWHSIDWIYTIVLHCFLFTQKCLTKKWYCFIYNMATCNRSVEIAIVQIYFFRFRFVLWSPSISISCKRVLPRFWHFFVWNGKIFKPMWTFLKTFFSKEVRWRFNYMLPSS